jgi:hypothetical protein
VTAVPQCLEQIRHSTFLFIIIDIKKKERKKNISSSGYDIIRIEEETTRV